MGHFCGECGSEVHEGAAHCAECGAAVHAAGAPTPPAGTPAATPPPMAPAPAPAPAMGAKQPGPSNTPLIVALSVLGVILVGGIIALVVATRSSDDSGESESVSAVTELRTTTTEATTTTTEATTTTAATTTAAPTTAAPSRPADPGDVLAQPAGLFCRDLKALGYPYPDAVAYWSFHGAPDRMDADLNGIPCETVYPASDVGAYWGSTAVPGAASVPGGLYCRDLVARNFTYAEAVAYWFSEGAPDRMDADLDGYPCETVYPFEDVQVYWFG